MAEQTEEESILERLGRFIALLEEVKAQNAEIIEKQKKTLGRLERVEAMLGIS